MAIKFTHKTKRNAEINAVGIIEDFVDLAKEALTEADEMGADADVFDELETLLNSAIKALERIRQ